MSLRITVLGSEPAWPSASRACTGFLVETEEARVLVDCGTGVFARLRAVVAPEDLSAIVLTHLHFDHFADVIPFRYYLKYEARASIPPKLHVPPGAIEKLGKVVEPVDPSPGFFTGAFETSEYDPEGETRVGDLGFSFHRTRHPGETFAIKMSGGGVTVVYSADTGWLESLADFAREADLFICEATWADGEGKGNVHLSAADAGRLAALAGAKRLALTHLAEGRAEAATRAASGEFEGPVEHAAAGSALLP